MPRKPPLCRRSYHLAAQQQHDREQRVSQKARGELHLVSDAPMDPLHATVEECAAEGFTLLLPSMSLDEATDELAPAHLYGPNHGAVFGAAALCRVQRSTSLRKAMAAGRRVG
jgi:hypothetical protein